jgi:peptidoglycan/LPS O-acetylase OafA/YrhL
MFALSILFLSALVNRDSKVLDKLGRVSYEIYLLHGFFILLLLRLNAPSSLMIPLVMALTIIGAFPLHELNQRIIRRFQEKIISPSV